MEVKNAVESLLNKEPMLLEDLENDYDYRTIILTQAYSGILLNNLKVRITGNLDNIIIKDLNKIFLHITYDLVDNHTKTITVVIDNKDADTIRRFVKPSTGIDTLCMFSNNNTMKCIELTAFNLPLKFPYKICSGKDEDGNIINPNYPTGCGYVFTKPIMDSYCSMHCFNCGCKLEDVYNIYEFEGKTLL